MDAKLKHLEFIQAAIVRLSSTSFLVKGWTVTLVAALFALSAKDANPVYFLIAYIPIPFFWILDGYYLSQERAFRALYDEIRLKDPVAIDFSMQKSKHLEGRNSWSGALFSRSMLVFYLTLVITVLVVMAVISRG